MDPWLLPRWLFMSLTFWLRRLGPKWVFLGMAASTLLAIVLNQVM